MIEKTPVKGVVTNMEQKKLVLIGCGHLGKIVAQSYQKGLLPGYELVGVLGRTPEKAAALAAETHCKACGSLDELLALEPGYVVECASVQAVRDYALPILEAGAELVLLSIGALADPAFRGKVGSAARAGNTHVHLASGAIGGFDVLTTVSLMALASGEPLTAGIHTHKGPKSLENTPVYLPELAADTDERTVFTGNAVEAISLLPTKVNVAVAASLATAGPEKTGVQITSVPGFVGDDHRIEAKCGGVTAVTDIYSSTSDIAAWSAVALLQNLDSPIQFH